MGKAVGAVIGVAEIAAGLAIGIGSEGLAGEAAFGLVASGASELLGYAVSLLLNPHRSPLTPIGASYVGTLERPASAPETLGELTAIYLGAG